jgi:hypothetical protein
MKSFLSLETDTEINEIDNLIKKGGNVNNYKKKATGSFPPIYRVSKDQFKDDDNNKTRQFSKTEKTVLSIKDIMQERRDENKPFIAL